MKENRFRPLALSLALISIALPSLQAAPAGATAILAEAKETSARMAATKPAYELFVSSEAGYLRGEALEIVYYGPGSQSVPADYIQSRLDWSLQNLPLFGSRLEIETRKGLFASLRLRTGIPGLYGSIEDRDWLNDDGVLTHYSKHDNYLERALFADFAAGWNFRLSKRLAVGAGLGLELMSFKWTARDGYIQYPPEAYPGPYTPWSEALPKENIYGTGMAYEQLHLVASLELRAKYLLAEKWSFAASFGFSPIAYCQDLDNHLLTATDYRELMYGGLYFEPGFELGYALKPGAELLLSGSGRWIAGLIGDAWVIPVTPQGAPDNFVPAAPYGFNDGGGAEYSALSLGLALRMRL